MNDKTSKDGSLISPESIERSILLIRHPKVMLDSDLAEPYGVTTKRLNEQVKRNDARFAEDFMFRLTVSETEILRSQIATSRKGGGGRRYRPYAFTEQNENFRNFRVRLAILQFSDGGRGRT